MGLLMATVSLLNQTRITDTFCWFCFQEQYKFCHDVLLEFLSNPDTSSILTWPSCRASVLPARTSGTWWPNLLLSWNCCVETVRWLERPLVVASLVILLQWWRWPQPWWRTFSLNAFRMMTVLVLLKCSDNKDSAGWSWPLKLYIHASCRVKLLCYCFLCFGCTDVSVLAFHRTCAVVQIGATCNFSFLSLFLFVCE